MRLALAGLALAATVLGGTATAEAHDRYYYDRHPPRVRYVPAPRVYYPPPYYYAPAPVYVVPRPVVPYGYYPAYPYPPPAAASFSFTFRGH